MNLKTWRNKGFGGGGDLAPRTGLSREMDRLFDSFVRGPFESAMSQMGMAYPPLDVIEGDNEVTVRAEVPGIEPADLDVSVTGDVLTISGEKKEHTERKGQHYFHTETRSGSFRRSISLPSGVDPQNVQADYQQGVLTVRLQKKPSSQPTRVQVNLG